MKLQFIPTPNGSIRVWMTFDEDQKGDMTKTKEFAFFQLASIWDGYDKVEANLFSWELSMKLKEFIKERFGHRTDCEIHDLLL